MLHESKAPALCEDLFQRHPTNPILTAHDWPYPAHPVFNAGACLCAAGNHVAEDHRPACVDGIVLRRRPGRDTDP